MQHARCQTISLLNCQSQEKDAALRKAKLDYINQHAHREAHPFYWAGLVPLGDMEPVVMNTALSGWVKYGLLLIGAALFLFWLLKRPRNIWDQSIK